MCLDAFVVALDQACGGGKKRWYASTLELQLVSVKFCGACRSVPTLGVAVEARTPFSLWYRVKKPEHLPIGSSSRVPFVRALSLRWALPTEFLRQRAAIQLWDWLEDLEVTGTSPADRLETVVWPKRLKRLGIATDLKTSVQTVPWPASLERLCFGGEFNQPIGGVGWPVTLQHLSLSNSFNQPIEGIVWPASLKVLLLGTNFNQPTLEPGGRHLCKCYLSDAALISPSLEWCGRLLSKP